MAYQKIPFAPDYGGVTADDMNHIQTQYDEAAADLNAHKSASPLDHPDGSVTAAKIASGAVGTTQLANNAVTTSKIADNAVTTAKIASGAVGATQLANNAVTSSKIATGAVIAGKLADGAVDTLARIASGIRTIPGGTEANRLAVTNANGRVGDSQLLQGLTPGQVAPQGSLLKRVTSQWCIPGWALSGSLGSHSLAAGTLYYIPIYMGRAATFDRIGIHVREAGGAGARARLGIYAWSDGHPGALIRDAGTVAVDSTGLKAIIINQALTHGMYFLAVVSNADVTCYGPTGSDIVAVPVATHLEQIAITSLLPHTQLIVGGRMADVANGLPSVAPAATGVSNTGAVVYLREA